MNTSGSSPTCGGTARSVTGPVTAAGPGAPSLGAQAFAPETGPLTPGTGPLAADTGPLRSAPRPSSPTPGHPSASLPRYGIRAGWMMTASGWSANQFSALLGAYRSELGLSASAVTGLFAVYVVGLIPGLLVAGPLADRRGRRPVALTALAVLFLASCLLMAGPAASVWLLPGRFLTGVAAGALMAAGSAWIKELSSPPFAAAGPAGVAARRSGLFVTAGFASGGLVASLIAQWAPQPMLLAYVPHLVLTAGAWLVAYRAPETRTGRENAATADPAPRSRPDMARFRRAIVPLAPWIFIGPSVGFAVLPGLVNGGLTGWQTVYAGLATTVVPGAGLLAQPLARRLAARSRRATAAAGLLVTVAGLALAAPAAGLADPVLALVAGAALGAGYGLGLTYALGEVAALAPPEHLARVTAFFWTLAYLGMFAPYVLSLLSSFAPMAALLGAGAVLAAATCLLHAVLNRRGGR
ncbi:MFS transporter [Streptomyces sp. NPDC003077]|uniref:MFS transporter n=1 Tax=Streptomyces sp. NPDC003077 TaxID=3154443 RepID=UPI0033A381D5